MILLSTGSAEDFIIVLLVLLFMLLILQLRKRFCFRILARVNKIILPSLYKRNLSSLKKYEKIVLGYRYWITRNSL